MTPADVLGSMPTWQLSADRPALTSPSGREHRLAATREVAVHVIRAVTGAILESPGVDVAGVRAIPLPELFGLMASALRESDAAEAILGAAVAQWLDVMLWELSWDDVAPEVGHA